MGVTALVCRPSKISDSVLQWSPDERLLHRRVDFNRVRHRLDLPTGDTPIKSPRAIAPPARSAAKDALRRGAWTEAREHLEKSIAAGETAEALEQLGLATWWLDDAALTFDARERSYRLYREHDDPLGAARVALWLVWDYLAFRGDTAVASGWLERARRLLAGHERSAEYGWLLLRDGEV